MKRNTAWGKLYIFLIFLFLYAPIAIILLFSFNSSSSTYVFEGFSTHWYKVLFEDAIAREALKNTLILAIASSIIATVMGTLSAVGIDSMKKKWTKTSVMTATNIPMMNPEIVTGISMMLLFVFAGALVNITDVLGFWTMLIAHVTFCLPYVILSVLPKIRQTDSSLYEAAQDLGCSPLKAFFRVVLPSILPGILSGAVMAFTLSLDDFIISYFTSGPDFQTLPIYIFSMTKKRVKPDMYALSAIIFIVILVLLILFNMAQSMSEKNSQGKKLSAKVKFEESI